jgi:hypothetical protein
MCTLEREDVDEHGCVLVYEIGGRGTGCTREECLHRRHILGNMSPLESCSSVCRGDDLVVDPTEFDDGAGYIVASPAVCVPGSEQERVSRSSDVAHGCRLLCSPWLGLKSLVGWVMGGIVHVLINSGTE